MEIFLSQQNFEQEVLNSKSPVLVDFYADWCGPCRLIAPILSEIANEFNGKVKVCKVNVDENEKLAIKFGIMSIPTIICFKNGAESGKIIGYTDKDKIINLFQA